MTETNPFGPQLRRLANKTDQITASIDWRVNPILRGARQELVGLTEIFEKTIDPANPPKMLQVSHGGVDYTSIRRIEGKDLFRPENQPDTDKVSDTFYEVKPQLIPDGAIGVLYIPVNIETVNARIAKQVPPDDPEIIFQLDAALEKGITFKPQDWTVESGDINLIKRIGDKFYTLGYTHQDIIDRESTLDLVEPDKDTGQLPLGRSVAYLSAEIKRVRQIIEADLGRFYVLVKGSAEKKGKPQQLKKLDAVEASQ